MSQQPTGRYASARWVAIRRGTGYTVYRRVAFGWAQPRVEIPSGSVERAWLTEHRWQFNAADGRQVRGFRTMTDAIEALMEATA